VPANVGVEIGKTHDRLKEFCFITGCPLALQEVELLCETENNDSLWCSIASVLRGGPGPLAGCSFNDDLNPFDSDSEGEQKAAIDLVRWGTAAGAHLLFRPDSRDLTIQDLDLIYAFAEHLEQAPGQDVQLAEVFPCFREFAKAYRATEDEHQILMEALATSAQWEEQTIAPVVHAEIPAYLDEEVAASQVQLQWEDHISVQAMSNVVLVHTPDSENDGHNDVPPQKINLLRVGSPASSGDSLTRFREALLTGPHLKACREALQINQPPLDYVLPQGSFMIVTPQQYHDARHALVGFDLQPFNLVVAEQFDYIIEEMLAGFTSKRRPRIKPGASGRQVLRRCSRSQSEEAEADSSEGKDDERRIRSWTVEMMPTIQTVSSTPLNIMQRS